MTAPSRGLDRKADDRDRQAADPICQAAAVSGGRSSGNCLASTVPSAKPIAPPSAIRIPGSFAMLAAKPLPPMMRGEPGERHHQRQSPAAGRPLAEHRPGQQRGPDRHGVGDQRGLAGRQPEQRQPHQHHPAGDVEEAGQHQPRPQSRAARAGSGRAASASAASSSRADHAGRAAQRSAAAVRPADIW